jgi:hypothetical protein
MRRGFQRVMKERYTKMIEPRGPDLGSQARVIVLGLGSALASA